MPLKKPLLICIIGPTAIGKTKLAISLAQEFTTEIISADSRQFFKEMTIGTAVPTKEELATVPHHFIQNKSIFESYSVGDFERDAIETLHTLFKKQKIAIMVGGSGLYVDAVVNGLDLFPEIPVTIREKLNSDLAEKGIEFLQQELKKVDEDYFKKVDIQNPHRLIRALEVYRTCERPYSSFLLKNKTQRFFNTLYIGLKAERTIVYERINKRVDVMIADGLLEEAKQLHPHKHLNALQTVGYRELFNYFESEWTLDFSISEIKKNTRRFAKRQNTWFTKNDKIQWFEIDEISKIIAFIKAKNA